MKFLFDHCLIDQAKIVETANQLTDYTRYLNQATQDKNYETDESSMNLPFDEDIKKHVEQVKQEKVSSKLKYFINIGIGGSAFGARAVYDLLYGYFDSLEPERFPKMFFADTIDPEFLTKLTNFLKDKVKDPEELLVNLISKSGSTTESIANIGFLETVIAQFNERVVVTTNKDSPLWEKSQELQISSLAIPDKVGGRYSVLSPVGLFPLACVGIDIEGLLEGARQMRDHCVVQDPWENSALFSAALLFLHYQNGRDINDQFFFHSEMESLGKWYRQLLGESLGKGKDLDGKEVHAGLMPSISIGSTDLHSVVQLYFAKSSDKFTNFIWTEKNQGNVFVPDDAKFNSLTPHISGKSARDIMAAILQAVKSEYKNHAMPFTETVLSDLTPKSIGEWMQFKMLETMYLGKLLNVNAFDQPEVEAYKVETEKILTGG